MADKIYTVTVASGNLYPSGSGTGNVFYVDGVRDLTIEWISGATIRFDQSASSNDGHPLLFADDSSNPLGTIKSTNVVYYLDGSSDQSAYSNTTSFNAATTRYIEITPNSESDFFYFCYVHGIGMGGEIDITQDTWGALSWSQGNYGAQNDQSPIPSSQVISTASGTATIDSEINVGWGARTWGFTDWGAAGNLVTGQTMTMANNFAGVNVTTTVGLGWGRGRWGEQVWGEPNEAASLTGQQLETSLRPEPVSFSALADAQLSTDQNKFGGTSLKLDGSGDRIQSGDITLGTSDYTWETFAYFNSFSSTQCIWDAGENVGASQNPVVYITSTNLQLSYAGGTYINAAHGMSTGQWHHIAITRNGNNLTAYIDGSSIGTATYSLGSGATNHVLGGNFAGTFTMNGYLDESRLSTEVIYTSNFTPPTSPFSGATTDTWLLHYDGDDGSTTITNSATPETLTITTEINTGWGRKTWDESAWGITGTLLATGQSVTTAIASVTATAEVNIGWGRRAWNDQTWGSPDEAGEPTGINIASSLGSPTITGQINLGWGRLTWGTADWGEGADETVSVTGFELSTKTNEKTVGWGDLSWGSQTWGFSTTSVIEVVSSVELTGQSMTMTLGDEAGFTDVTIIPTGIALTPALGTTTQECPSSVV